MLQDLALLPPDPLLNIIKLFREDQRRDKIDLGVGVYRDESGNTPIMAAVKQAEQRLLGAQETKAYVGQQGDAEFVRLLGELAFADEAKNVIGIQSVGGTGALRLGFELLKTSGAKRLLLPTPSWPNHPALIRASGLEQIEVPFFDVASQRIDLDGLIGAFAQLSKGDAVLLQGCCHNPLGADFSLEHWDALTAAMAERGLIPFIDTAYQGFGDGLDEDAAPVRRCLARVPEAVMAISGAKIFGLYRERVGALFVKGSEQTRQAALTNLFTITRAIYSMPPDHGAACVREVLGDADLRTSWKAELDGIRAHIKKTRAALASARVNSIPMHLIGAQKGMFSTLPLTRAQIETLREEHGVYMSNDGRINVAGLREADIPRFLSALAAVTG